MDEIKKDAMDNFFDSNGVNINSSITSTKDARKEKLNPDAKDVQRRGYNLSIGEIVSRTKDIYDKAAKEFAELEVGRDDVSKDAKEANKEDKDFGEK